MKTLPLDWLPCIAMLSSLSDESASCHCGHCTFLASWTFHPSASLSFRAGVRPWSCHHTDLNFSDTCSSPLPCTLVHFTRSLYRRHTYLLSRPSHYSVGSVLWKAGFLQFSPQFSPQPCSPCISLLLTLVLLSAQPGPRAAHSSASQGAHKCCPSCSSPP